MKVLTSLGAEEFATSIIWTNVGSINFTSSPSKVLLSSILGIWRRGALLRGFFVLVSLAVYSAKSFLLLGALLNSGLSFLGF
jgi:hypothetical protein